MNVRLKDEDGHEIWTGTLAEMMADNPEDADDIQLWADGDDEEMAFGGGAGELIVMTRTA